MIESKTLDDTLIKKTGTSETFLIDAIKDNKKLGALYAGLWTSWGDMMLNKGYSAFLHEGSHAILGRATYSEQDTTIYYKGDLRPDTQLLFGKFTEEKDMEGVDMAVNATDNPGYSQFIAGLAPTIIFAPIGYTLWKHGVKKSNLKEIVAGTYLLGIAGSTSTSDAEGSVDGLAEEIKRISPELCYGLVDLPVLGKYAIGMIIAMSIAGGIVKTGQKIYNTIKKVLYKPKSFREIATQKRANPE